LLPAGLRRLSRTIPDIHDQQDITTTPADAGGDNVNLFLGCTGELFDRTTLASSKRLLERLGYRVNIPARQTCCGAVHQHNGDPETAGQLAQTNHRVFAADNNPILVTASGCTAHLLSDNALAGRVSDILDFLLKQSGKKLKLQPFAEKVALYVPCTHRNSLKQQQTIVDILKLIPGLQPLFINPQGGCCGAAGSYMFSQPELSDQLRAPVIEKLAESGANVLLTTNIGCSIHLQVGLKERGLEIDVLHPVVLLDRLLVTENGDV